MEFKKEAIRGISWVGLLRISTKILGFLEAIVLARILLPEQFGAYGVALLALGLLEVLTESGINIVLVQEKEVDKYVNSAWVISILRGIFIAIALLLFTPLIAEFFRSPQSRQLLYLICLVPLLRGFINPSVVKLQKDLKFGKDFIYRMMALFIDTIVTVVVTYLTGSPVGIVIGLIAGVFTELLLSFILVSPRPRLVPNVTHIKKIFHRGKWVTASTIFDYLFYNADNIAVGRILGAGALGIYQLGYSLAVVPLSEVGKVFVHVTVPIMIKISNNSDKMKRAFFTTLVSIAIITLPFAFLFASFPHVIVYLLGEKWRVITTILPILGVLGFVKSVSLASNALFLSLNKQEYTTVITFVHILGLIISLVPLITSYGILGAGLSALLGTAAAVPFIIYFTYKALSDIKKYD